MERAFVDFTFMKDIDLGSKVDMSYQLRCLLNESIDLSIYGKTVESILFSPIIGPIFEPESEYDSLKKELRLEFYIEPEEAIQSDHLQFFHLHLDGLIKALDGLEYPPEDFDHQKLIEDIEDLRSKFDQLKAVV